MPVAPSYASQPSFVEDGINTVYENSDRDLAKINVRNFEKHLVNNKKIRSKSSASSSAQELQNQLTKSRINDQTSKALRTQMNDQLTVVLPNS